MTDDIPGAPNCPACLHPLEIAGSDQRPYWSCTTCGYAAISD